MYIYVYIYIYNIYKYIYMHIYIISRKIWDWSPTSSAANIN